LDGENPDIEQNYSAITSPFLMIVWKGLEGLPGAGLGANKANQSVYLLKILQAQEILYPTCSD
jgi:hypothetical protein